jgi:tetratricopeptide (TPR) repeat protein
MRALVLGVAVAGAARAAAPPMTYRLLTAEEQRQVAALTRRMNQQAGGGDFEEAERLARDVLALRERVQGKRHWQSVDARLEVEHWQRLRAVPVAYRGEVGQGLRVVAKADALRARGRYREAEQAGREALALLKKALGEGHPATATAYSVMAYNLEVQGKYAQAQPLYAKALAIHQKALGENHPETAISLNNLALNLDAQGKYPRAQPLFEKALAIRRKALGEDHPRTARGYNNLALNLDAQGKYARAQPLFEKALAIRRKALGENHPHTAISYHGMASNLNYQGKYAEAQPLYEKALAIYKKALGEDHAHTGAGYNGLAQNLSAQGSYAQAHPLYERALAISQKTRGENHPRTATCYNNLAANLNKQGKYAQAQPFFEKALAICKLLGEDHPHTAGSYNNLASNLNAQGKYAQAQSLYAKALAIRRKVLGEHHPDTALSYYNLASNLRDQRNCARAQPLFEKALAIYKKAHGEDHPDTARGYHGVASNLDKQEKYAQAQPLHERALAINKKVLGEDHPHTAASYNCVAFDLDGQDKYAQAQPLYAKALAIRQKALGEHHPDTASCYNNLAAVLWKQGKKNQAMLHWQAACRTHGAARLDRAAPGFDRSLGEGRFLSPYAALAVALARQGKAEEAFRLVESRQARGLLEALGTGTEEQDRKHRAGLERVRQLDELLVPLLGRSQLPEAHRQRRDALLEERADLLSKLARQAAEDAERLLLPLAQIQEQLPADSALVLWVPAAPLGADWACVLRSKGPPIWQRLPGTGPDKAWTWKDQYLPAELLALLSNPRSSPAQRQRLVRAVQEQRLAPLRPHLKGARRLLLVATWPMEALPFEVLSEDYLVSYVPSASLFARARKEHRPLRGSSLLALGDPVFAPPAPATPPGHGVLLTQVLPKGGAARAGLRAGDVLLSLGGRQLRGPADLRQALAAAPAELAYWREGQLHAVRLGGAGLGARFDGRPGPEAVRNWRELHHSLLLRGTGHKPLPGTRREVQALARLVPRTTLLLGSAASEQRLAQLASSGHLRGFRLLHLATHGDVDPDPKRSALILSQDRLPARPAHAVLRGRRPLDGRLTVETILRDWELDADLVVLSACQSGLGQESGGEGLVGFAHAFLQKKARSVVVSRWKVDDTATTLLMVRFYENLLGQRKGTKAMSRAPALDEARRWLRGLSRKQAVALAGRLERGALRGTEEEVPALAEKEPSLPAGERPFAHPFYWAAFILLGDPG